MVDNKADNLAVEKDDQAHWHYVADDKQYQYKKAILISVGEIVE